MINIQRYTDTGMQIADGHMVTYNHDSVRLARFTLQLKKMTCSQVDERGGLYTEQAAFPSWLTKLCLAVNFHAALDEVHI